MRLARCVEPGHDDHGLQLGRQLRPAIPPSADEDQSVPTAVARPLRWRRELAYAAVFYGVYSLTRDTQGSAAVSAAHALHNATRIVHLERSAHLFVEASMQRSVLAVPGAGAAANVFYESAHFVVTVVMLVWLYRSEPERFRSQRTFLGVITALGLVGFSVFPLLPPRLLPTQYGFVDTLRRYPIGWSYHSATVQRLSNQYAAMPSLHFAWALWAALAARPAMRSRWTRQLAWAYPAITAIVVVATANHYLADLVGGAATVGLAGLLLWSARRAVRTPTGRPSSTRMPRPYLLRPVLGRRSRGRSLENPALRNRRR